MTWDQTKMRQKCSVTFYLWNLVNSLDILFKAGRRPFQLVSCLESSLSSIKYSNWTWLEIVSLWVLVTWLRTGWALASCCLGFSRCPSVLALVVPVCWRLLCWQWVGTVISVLIKVVSTQCCNIKCFQRPLWGNELGGIDFMQFFWRFSFFLFNFIYFWLCSVLLLWGLFSSCGEQSPLRFAVSGLLVSMVCLIWEHRLWVQGLH